MNALTLVLTLVMVVAGGTIFFRHVEQWSWLDSYFFTVVTISTVGYGELVPQTPPGRIGTTVLIFFGLAIFAVAIQRFGLFAMQKRQEHTEWLIARLSGQVDPDAANKDKDPQA